MRARFLYAALVALALVPFLPALIRGEVFTLRDHSDYFIPLHQYTTDQILAGELPLWNPLNGNGEQWLANPQTAVFYPPALVFLLLPFATAYVLFLALHVAVLAAGSFLLFRRWVDAGPAFFGAVCLSLSGPTLSLLDVSNNLRTFAWIPLVLWAALERTGTESRLPVTVPCTLLALLFLGGEPFLALVGALLYSIIAVSRKRSGALREIGQAGILAALLSMVQIIPFLGMLAGSDRASGFERELAFRESLHPADWSLLTLSPALSGGEGLIESSQSYIPILYAGTAVVFLALLGVAGALRRDAAHRSVVFAFTGLFAGVAVVAAGSHLGSAAEVLVALKVTVNRYPARLIPLGALAVCALAALGAHSLRMSGRGTRAAALAALVALVAYSVSNHDPVDPAAVPLAAGLLALQGLLLLLMILKPDRLRLIVPLGLLVAADLLVAARPLLMTGPHPAELPAFVGGIEPSMKIARLPDLDRRSDSSRLDSLPGYTNLAAEVHNISTAAPVSDRRAMQLHDQALFTPDAALLRFMSVGYLITNRPLSAPGIAPLATSGAVRLHTLAGAWPMATLWKDLRPLEAVLNSSESPGAAIHLKPDGEAHIQRMGSSEAVVRISTDAPAMLVLNQLDAAGWTVSVDGEPAEGLRMGGLFRAVRVPEGDHLVHWRYAPPFFTSGLMISLLTALFLVMMTIHLSRSARGVVGWRNGRARH